MPHTPPLFSYDEAFSRNLGWVTETEQQRLKASRVCIAGLGGVGGIYLLTLARLGISAFTIADFDSFALANFNRQAGATVSSLGHPKIDVMAAMARDINPGLDLRLFRGGLNDSNLVTFSPTATSIWMASISLRSRSDVACFRCVPKEESRQRPSHHWVWAPR